MKLVPVDNTFAEVSDEDYELLSKFRWRLNPNGYAFMTFPMHRMVLQPPLDKVVDHIDHNRLNNQRNNLRPATPAQNSHSQRRNRNAKYRYRGVKPQIESSTWRCEIRGNHIGSFPTEHLAALAYDLWAVDIYGPFAQTNLKVATKQLTNHNE
jgi:hypothetical protein